MDARLQPKAQPKPYCLTHEEVEERDLPPLPEALTLRNLDTYTAQLRKIAPNYDVSIINPEWLKANTWRLAPVQAKAERVKARRLKAGLPAVPPEPWPYVMSWEEMKKGGQTPSPPPRHLPPDAHMRRREFGSRPNSESNLFSDAWLTWKKDRLKEEEVLLPSQVDMRMFSKAEIDAYQKRLADEQQAQIIATHRDTALAARVANANATLPTHHGHRRRTTYNPTT